ncbi:MAG TPA: protein phosphatase 2C domain-containing protein [Caulobacteraceae bacterium]|nr:protein phosphatase 2C domain-containing protein [Caulobacteraceae bacterium]
MNGALRKPAPPLLRYRSVATSHVGGRTLNEDRFLQRPDVGLWAVADGMGGHQAGEVAAGMVVEALEGLDRFGSGYHYLNAVNQALQGVNAALIARAGAAGPGALIGSTVVTLMIHDGHYACLWAGDSRAYLSRSGALARLTQDHSLVQEMVDAGALTPEQSRTHRRANVITRAVGVAQPLVLDMLHAAVEPGDVFLLCSDGLTGAVEDVEIEAVLRTGELEPAAEALIYLALERGARDNVTLVLVQAQPARPN